MTLRAIFQDKQNNSTTTSELYLACKNYEVEKVKTMLQFATIEEINHIEPNGSTALHVASYYGHVEIVELLLQAGASRSIRNKSHKLTAYEEARSEEIKRLFYRNYNDNHFMALEEIPEWTLVYRDPAKICVIFRQVLSYASDNNIKLDGIINYYLNELLLDGSLSPKDKRIIESFCILATKNPIYLIKAYTSVTNFYKILNKHLAVHAINYFEATLSSTINYKLVKCVIDFVSIIESASELKKYSYIGQTYRGMTGIEEDLHKYIVGSKILTTSFLSTTKDKQIAEIYAAKYTGFNFKKSERSWKSYFEGRSREVSVFYFYTLKTHQSAFDIEHISEVQDEKEVLILPFTAFYVKAVRKLPINNNIEAEQNNVRMVEIELEECDDEQETQAQGQGCRIG